MDSNCRSRRKESLSSLSKLHKPNYNPDRYVDISGNCSTNIQSLPNESPTPLTNSRLTQRTGVYQSSLSNELFDMSMRHIRNHESDLLKQSKTEGGVTAASKSRKGGLSLYSVSDSQGLRSEDLVLSPPYVPDGATANGWSVPLQRGLTDEAMMSPETERSQTSEATSLSLMSTSVESGDSTSPHGSNVLALLLRQPSETAVLAQQYFPVTFGATTPRPVNSRDPLLHVQPTLTLSKKLPSRSLSAGHHRHRRPGSGHSSSSSNSKSSVDRIYLNVSDAQGHGKTWFAVYCLIHCAVVHDSSGIRTRKI